MDIATQKAIMREHVLKTRRTLPNDARASLSRAACARTLDLLDAHLDFSGERAPLVATYCAMKNELDTTHLIERLYARGAHVAFPCTRGPLRMEFMEVNEATWRAAAIDFLARPGRFFPDQDFPGLTAVDPEALDAIVVPGAAFDESGMRLGLGAGCYDAFLPQVRKGCLVAGIAFDEQLCEQIPADAHDRRMSVVVTPTRTIEPA